MVRSGCLNTVVGSLRACCYVLTGIVFLCADACYVGAQEEAAPPAAEPGEPPAVQAPRTRLETQIELEQLLEEENYDAAAIAAQQLLDLAIAEYGEGSREVGHALQKLAEAQRLAGQLNAAELNYLNAIETFRSVDGPFSELTIDPSIGLGDTYQSDGQYMNAVSAYNEARTLQRRLNGLLSEEQIKVMDRMTRSFQSMAMHVEADEQQREAMTLVERIYGPDSEESLQAIYKYARWLQDVYRFSESREQYERAIRIIRAAYGKENVLLVEPYRGIGNSFRSQGLQDPRGASALRSAVELLENEEQPDALLLAEALTDVGDWETAFEPSGSGHEAYRKAWNLLSASPQGLEQRTESFQSSRPRVVLLENMSIRGLASNPNDPEAVQGHVLIRFDVDPFGRTQNVSIVESVPPGFKDDSAQRSMSLSRFRPRMEDGDFVFARDRGYMITFSYMPNAAD